MREGWLKALFSLVSLSLVLGPRRGLTRQGASKTLGRRGERAVVLTENSVRAEVRLENPGAAGSTSCRVASHGTPFTGKSLRSLAGVIESAECVTNQALDLLKESCCEVAAPTKRIQCGAKELGRRFGPYWFPKPDDTRYGECAQCAGSVFAGPRVSKALRLGAHLGAPYCLPRA